MLHFAAGQWLFGWTVALSAEWGHVQHSTETGERQGANASGKLGERELGWPK